MRPHGVNRINFNAGGWRQYQYDGNGNITVEQDYNTAGTLLKSRVQSYTSFNMPISIGRSGLSLAFYYGPEHQRVKQLSSASGATYYLNPGNEGGLAYEKDVKPDGSTEQRYYINAYGQAVILVKLTNNTTFDWRYLHRDNLRAGPVCLDRISPAISGALLV